MKTTLSTCAFIILATLPAYPAEKQAQPAVQQIDAHVRKVEESGSRLARKEVKLEGDALKKVTEAKWAKIHTYSDGKQIMRLKVYPSRGSKTEEYYYRSGKLVMVFMEATGAGKEGHQEGAEGTKYYFENGKLLAVAQLGEIIEPDEKARTAGEKLLRESTAFLAAAK